MKKQGVTCLIPFYNEGQRVIDTLNIVSRVPDIEAIICVDDGSTDNASQIILKRFPRVQLIRLRENQGKTEAIRQGLARVQSPYVLLLDADLQALQANGLEEAIELIQNKPDIVILQRIHEPFFVRLFRFDIILSGQRILKTAILREILKTDYQHYDLEVAMNAYAVEHSLRVAVFPISVVNSRRIDKWGVKHSVASNISMFVRFIKYPGLMRFINQVLFFARSRSTLMQWST